MLEIKNFNIFKESYRAIWKDQIDVNAVNKLTYACNAQQIEQMKLKAAEIKCFHCGAVETYE